MAYLDVLRLRLHNQRLDKGTFARPEEVVRWFGAMQAQEFGPAKWSVGQRTVGCGDAEVSAAIADGRILRTHTLRPTWHFVARDDIRWVMTVTAPRVHQSSKGMYRQLELDEETLARAHKAIAGAIESDGHRTRAELGDALGAAGIQAKGQRLAYIVMHAELEALICSGAPRGKQQTYALVEERAPKATILPPDEALAELTRRYYTSHGPATVKDLAKWASLTMAEVKRGLEMVGDALIGESVDGRSYWFAEPGGPLPPLPSPTAHLLQLYDELFMGYFESRDLVNIASLTTNPAIWPLMHAVLLDSRVIGNWQRTEKHNELQIEVQLNREISRDGQAAIQTAAEDFGRFVGLPVTVDMNEGT
jgi:hypothetical protein